MSQIYSNAPVLSKIKLGANTYWMKDADARAILDTLGSAAYLSADNTITDGATGVAKTSAIKAYVDSLVSVGLVVEVVSQLPTATADTMGKIYMVAHTNPETSDYYDEYLTIRTGEDPDYSYNWEKIGDTRIDLSNYYTKDEIDALFANLGDMASADTASATYIPAGTVSTPTITVTPATDTVKVNKTTGSVTAGTAASIAEGFFSAGTLPTKAADSFTANTPTAIDTTKFNGGSKAADSFTPASLGNPTKSSFATEGVTVALDGTDSECLAFSTAGTAQAVTAQGIFDGGSFTEGAFTPASLASGFITPGTAATFTEGAFNGGSLPSVDTTKFNGGTPTAVTLPTFEDATVVTGITSATSSQPTFTGTSATITVTPDSE